MSFKKQKIFIVLVFILLFLTIILMSSEPPFNFHPPMKPPHDHPERRMTGEVMLKPPPFEDGAPTRESGLEKPGPGPREGKFKFPGPPPGEMKKLFNDFMDRAMREIPRDQRPGTYETEFFTYSLADTAELVAAFTREILTDGACINEKTGKLVFFRKLVQDSGEVNVALEMKRGPERNFIGFIYTRKLLIFTSILIIAGIAIFFIFVSYRHSVDAMNENQKYLSVKRMSHGLAHEIRNPLNAMHLSLEVLRASMPDGADRAEMDKCVSILDSEINRLDELVRRFMEYSKEIKLRKSRGSMSETIRSAIDMLAPVAAEKNAAITLDCEGPAEGEFDRDLVYQSLVNVIKNAVEASAVGGRIEIACRMRSSCAIVTVSDRGEGISAENMPRIFDFYFSTKKEGSGIGLALSKKFVEAHGGTISAASGGGETVFTIKLPL